MLRFAANLSTMYTELPFLERFAAARRAGFNGVEFQFAYDHNPHDIAAELATHNLNQVLFNLLPGDFTAGDRGLAAVSGREAEFEASVTQALEYADILDCQLLHCMAGIPTPSDDPEKVMRTYIANLQSAASQAASHDVTILVEPVNHRNAPGFFLVDIDTARQVIEAVGADNVGLQFDFYHRQVVRGDLVHAFRDNLDITRHVQIANPPERADPGNGEINFPYIFREIEKTGYDGWIGCEYTPLGATEDSLAWFEPYKTE